MKTLLTIFIAGFISCSFGQIGQRDLRIFGTNLYDFSRAYGIKYLILNEYPTYGIYNVNGTVVQTNRDYIIVKMFAGLKFKLNSGGAYVPNGEPVSSPNYDEETRAIQTVQKKAYQIAQGIAALPPAEQLNEYNRYSDPFSRGYIVQGFLDPDPIYVNIHLLNYPIRLGVGSGINCYAIPVSNQGVWDYGKPFTGDSKEFSKIYHVLSDRIVSERQYSPEEREAKRRQSDATLLAWQQQQASNGVAYSQFDLGLRYFKADGVQSNQDLAFDWIKKSADQQYQPALQFLSTNNPPPSSNNRGRDH
jgi:hypothetical protein